MNDLSSPGLVFRGRGGTPRAGSDPSGFDVQVDLETQQAVAGMGGSNRVGAGRMSARSDASVGVSYMHQQGMAPPEVCVHRRRMGREGFGISLVALILS